MPDSDVPVQVSPRRGAGGTTQHPSGRTTTVVPVLAHEELPSPEKEPGWPLNVYAQLRNVHSVLFTIHQPDGPSRETQRLHIARVQAAVAQCQNLQITVASSRITQQ